MTDWQWFRGEYATWAEARDASVGYDDPAILERVLRSTLRVARGEAAFERDGMAFDAPFSNRPLLRALGLARRVSGDRLRVVDVGGALGSAYWQHRRELAAFESVRWQVVEQPHYVAAGRRELESGELGFHTSLESACSEGDPNLVLASSSLQYVPDPPTTLSALVALRAPWVFIDRLPLLPGKLDRLSVEQVPPQLGATSYPAWFLSEERFLDAFAREYRLVDRFATRLENGAEEEWSVFGLHLRNQGFLFERRAGTRDGR